MSYQSPQLVFQLHYKFLVSNMLEKGSTEFFFFFFFDFYSLCISRVVFCSYKDSSLELPIPHPASLPLESGLKGRFPMLVVEKS